MRIPFDSTTDLLTALSRTQELQEKSLQQISSGMRIQVASDDPAAMAQWIQNRSRAARNDEFQHSVTALKGLLQTGDSTLNSVVLGLERAVSLGVRGATGTVSETDRAAIAEEVKGIRENLLSLANTTFQGTYIFAGCKVTTQPFTDSTDGVVYQGDTGVIETAIGEDQQTKMNVPGDQIFCGPGAEVFSSLDKLIAGLAGNDAQVTTDATAVVRKAFDQVTAKRVFYGNALNQLSSAEIDLDNEKLDLSTRENDIAGADQAAAISTLLNAQNARDAALAAVGKISQLSLLDYLG